VLFEATWRGGLGLGLGRVTADRKVKYDQALSRDERESARAIARMVGNVEQVVAESGDPSGV
jgi:hypothetical protein